MSSGAVLPPDLARFGPSQHALARAGACSCQCENLLWCCHWWHAATCQSPGNRAAHGVQDRASRAPVGHCPALDVDCKGCWVGLSRRGTAGARPLTGPGAPSRTGKDGGGKIFSDGLRRPITFFLFLASSNMCWDGPLGKILVYGIPTWVISLSCPSVLAWSCCAWSGTLGKKQRACAGARAERRSGRRWRIWAPGLRVRLMIPRWWFWGGRHC